MTETSQIGLPPREDEGPGPTSQDLWMARGLNVFGLVSPAANLGMIRWSPKDVRWFGVGVGVACGIALVYAWHADVAWLQSLAFWMHYGMVFLGLVHPLWPEVVAKAWNRFGLLIGKVMTFPIFALVYYLFVTPTALAVRVFGKDPLDRKGAPADSYWTDHEPPSKERYERQF